MTALAVIGALVAGVFVGSYRRREPCGRPHEPRAVALIDGERFHVCVYVPTMWGEDVLTMCTHCRRPPPTSIPGPPRAVMR